MLITSLIYLISNLWQFGHPLPVSGLVKRDWSAYLLAHDPVYQSRGWLVAKALQWMWPVSHLKPLQAFYLTLGSLGVGGLRLISVGDSSASAGRDWLRRTLRPWDPFILFSLLNLFSYIVFYHGSLSFTRWYYVIQPWLVVLLTAALFDELLARCKSAPGSNRWSSLKRRAGLLGLALIELSVPFATLVGLGQWVLHEHQGLNPEPLRDAAQWARANLPAEAVIGAWNAGAIGYLSERRVINLDGVVNSWEYYQTQRFDLCRYWQVSGIQYLVDVFDDHQALSVVPTYPFYARCADRLELVWSDHHYGSTWYVAVYRILPHGN